MRPLILDEEGEPLPLRLVHSFRYQPDAKLNFGDDLLRYMEACGAPKNRLVVYRPSETEISFYAILNENM